MITKWKSNKNLTKIKIIKECLNLVQSNNLVLLIVMIASADLVTSKWRHFLYHSWCSQGRNTEVVCHSLLHWTTFWKTAISALLTMPQPLTVWITINCGKFLRRWGCQTTWPASWEICMQVRKQQLELDVEQQIGSKSGKGYVKAVYFHRAYLT